MKLMYNVEDRPDKTQTMLFAFQQMIAIMAATLLVPMLMSSFPTAGGETLSFDPAAALFVPVSVHLSTFSLPGGKARSFSEVRSPFSAPMPRSSVRITVTGE